MSKLIKFTEKYNKHSLLVIVLVDNLGSFMIVYYIVCLNKTRASLIKKITLIKQNN